jgi:hypothetical protein
MFPDTGWSYNTSSGAAVTGGPSWEVTAGQARVYINDPSGATFKVIGTGMGIGIGVSAIPASATVSTTDFVSAGTNIYGVGNSHLDLDDFKSLMVIYNGNAVALDGSATGSVVFFVHLTTLQKINVAAAALTGSIIGVLAVLTASFKAVCFVASAELSTPNLGVDATGTAYWISSADKVDP